MQHVDEVLYDCTLEACIVLLTNVTQINLIIKTCDGTMIIDKFSWVCCLLHNFNDILFSPEMIWLIRLGNPGCPSWNHICIRIKTVLSLKG